MQVLSVNVGRPREVEWRGKSYRTSIWKSPSAGAVEVRTLNIDGDEQSDLSVHGGRNKAVYAYPGEHYANWAQELGVDLSWGAFGENLTIEGILGDAVTLDTPAEHDVTIADVAEAYATGGEDRNLLRRVAAVPALPEGLRQHFAKLLERA